MPVCLKNLKFVKFYIFQFFQVEIPTVLVLFFITYCLSEPMTMLIFLLYSTQDYTFFKMRELLCVSEFDSSLGRVRMLGSAAL